MKVVYDSESDAAYIRFNNVLSGEITDTVVVTDIEDINSKADINLDFDKSGTLRGIEFLGASKILPHELLEP